MKINKTIIGTVDLILLWFQRDGPWFFLGKAEVINLLTSSSNQFRIRKFVIEGVACQLPARCQLTCHVLYYNFLNSEWMISNFHDFFDQLKIVLQVFVEYLFLSGFFTSKTTWLEKWVVGSGEQDICLAWTTRIYLDGRVFGPIIKPRPTFGYFSFVIYLSKI